MHCHALPWILDNGLANFLVEQKNKGKAFQQL